MDRFACEHIFACNGACQSAEWILKASTSLNVSGVSDKASVRQTQKRSPSHLSDLQTVAVLQFHCIHDVRDGTICPGLIIKTEATRANFASHVEEYPSGAFDFSAQLSASGVSDG